MLSTSNFRFKLSDFSCRCDDIISIIKIVNLYISSFVVFILINYDKPMYIMGKDIKSYARTPSPFPREREGSLTAKVLNPSFKIWYGLTVHIIRF